MTAIKKMPKTPKSAILNTMRGVGGNILPFFRSKTEELGDTFNVDLGYINFNVTSNPEIIKHVLQSNQKNYRKSLAYRYLKMGLGNGLVTSEGEYWRKQRRLSQPVFYKKNLENLFQEMGRTTEEFINELENQRGNTIDISKEMMKVTATIVLRALFSIEEPKALDKIYHSMETMQTHIMNHVRNPIFIPYFRLNGDHRKFKKELEEMDGFVYDIMNERRTSGEKKPDLLQMLMDVEDADTGEKMTDQQLRDELITLFSAGHETSANAMAWGFYLLAQHPEVVSKIRKEVNMMLPDQQMPRFEDLRKLQYTYQVIEEVMRLYPPAWALGRRPLETEVVNGYELKKDVNILLEIFIMHRSPDLWENPNEFNPERFAPEAVKKRPKHHYLPFGAGPRMCIGNHFAMMEMQLLLATIIQRFDFELDESHKVELEPLITLRPKHGIKVKVVG